MIDTVRYWMAALLVISLPPAVLYWYVAHPFASFWRKLGTKLTFTVFFLLMAAGMVLLFQARDVLVVGDLGMQPVLVAVGLVFYTASVVMEKRLRKHLTLRTLVGIPEMNEKEPGGGTLLDQGMYGMMRHPRYVSVLSGCLGWSLMSNYVAAYVVTALMVPGLVGVAVLEERELVARFGSAYEEYRQRVPRFVPRF